MIHKKSRLCKFFGGLINAQYPQNDPTIQSEQRCWGFTQVAGSLNVMSSQEPHHQSVTRLISSWISEDQHFGRLSRTASN
ncbi:hypothetical protein BX616_009658, partial [Lobosporangium transversale]